MFSLSERSCYYYYYIFFLLIVVSKIRRYQKEKKNIFFTKGTFSSNHHSLMRMWNLAMISMKSVWTLNQTSLTCMFCFPNEGVGEIWAFVLSCIMRTDAREWDEIWRKQFSWVLSHDLHRKKTYKLKRSIVHFYNKSFDFN